MNIMECPEFRHLILLLRPDLKESDIPHRTKISDLILETWNEHFQVLKAELAVSVQLLIVQIIYFFVRRPKERSRSHLICGAISMPRTRTLRSLPIGLS